MLTNGGSTDGLFRGAFMQSGSPIPVGDITLGQKYYDGILAETNCSRAADSLACLRLVPYLTLKAAIKSVTPGIFSYQVTEFCVLFHIWTN
jgi:acetylcholinesterase